MSETTDTQIQTYLSSISDSYIYEEVWLSWKRGLKSPGKTSMGGENGGIFERNFDKGRVNGGFELFRIYAERDKERVES